MFDLVIIKNKPMLGKVTSYRAFDYVSYKNLDSDEKQRVLRDSRVFLSPVDNFPSQPFMQNAAGFVRNNVAVLANAQSMEEAAAFARRIGELKQGSSLPADITDDQAISLIRPRMYQNPNELSKYAESVAALDVARQQRAVVVAAKRAARDAAQKVEQQKQETINVEPE